MFIWQEIIVVGVVAMAIAYLVRRWRLRRKRGNALCGACGLREAARGARPTPLVQLKPPRRPEQ
jgi:hypothetical protein